MNKWLESALAWLVPTCCVLCRGPTAGSTLCPECAADLPGVGLTCRACGIEIPGGPVCPRCALRPPPVDRTVVAMPYNGAARRLVHELKFQGTLPVATLLGDRLATAVASAGGLLPDLLLPVPLHSARLRARGFNQALEVARVAGRGLGCPVAAMTVARRTRATPAQSGLAGTGARRRNVAGAFGASSEVLGARIAIVDDVMTTGATVFELARALRAAGALGVEAWVCCRAGRLEDPRHGPRARDSGVEVRHR